MSYAVNSKFIARLFAAVLMVSAIGFVAGCGDVQIDTSQLGQNNGQNNNDLSNSGLNPDPSWHSSYLVGSHSRFACSDCHVSVARTDSGKSPFREISSNQICANCHMGDYNRTGVFNHGVAGAGTYCNSCHYSDSFTSHTRIPSSQYHNFLSGSCVSCHSGKTPGNHMADGRTNNCESCHSYPNWQNAGGAHTYTSGCVNCHSSRTPSNHRNNGRTSNCEACHSYPTWAGASFNHSGVRDGCANCHSKRNHYIGYACELCHSTGINWNFRHRNAKTGSCQACHDGDGHGDGHGDWDD